MKSSEKKTPEEFDHFVDKILAYTPEKKKGREESKKEKGK